MAIFLFIMQKPLPIYFLIKTNHLLILGVYLLTNPIAVLLNPGIMKYTRSVIILIWVIFFSNICAAQAWKWARANTGSGVDGWAVATDKSGNVFVGGINDGISTATFGAITVPFVGTPSGYQCVIAKYDSTGNCLWAQGTQNGASDLIGIATDPSGNVFMLGIMEDASLRIGTTTLTNIYGPADKQYFLAKYDPAGNVLWVKNAGNAQPGGKTLVGGISWTFGLGAIATDASGNVFIAANFHKSSVTIGSTTLTNADASGTTDDILFVKYDPSGNVKWAKSIGGAGNDDVYAMTVAPSGDIYMAGDFAAPSLTFGPTTITNTTGGQVAFMARYKGSGEALWACSSGGSGGDYAAGLAADASGNIYLVGGLKENSISFSGTVITNPTPGKYALYLAKFDPSNNVSWSKTIFSSVGGRAYGYSVAASPCGSVWVSGPMENASGDTTLPRQVNVDGVLVDAPAGSYDPIFMAGYTSAGSYITAVGLQSGGDDENGLACDPDGNVYLCGDYACSTPFSIGTNNFPTDPTANEFLYVAKFAPDNDNVLNFKHSDTTMCFAANMLLNGRGGFTQYLWNDGNSGSSHSVADTGTFWVWGHKACSGSASDTFRVPTICDCSKFIFVPNTFTPNGDGQNDVFYPRSGQANTRIVTFRVYNRWGELMFERDNIMANDVANAWDGSYQGNLPLPDVYVYVLDAVCENGKVINKKGSVTVIR
jgi:gliding motility-associated-like protein